MDISAFPKYAGPDTQGLKGKMTREEVHDRFEAENAPAYSQRIRNWLPEDRYSSRLIVRALSPYLSGKSDARVLDLGAGTGRSAFGVLQAFPLSHVTLVDFSTNMLSEAPRLLKDYQEKFATLQADFWEVDFSDGGFDAVIACFALHHGRGQKIYGQLYRKVFRWLKPKGIFACCDVVEGDAPALSAMNESGWRSYLKHKGISKEEVRRLFSNYRQEDSPLSMRQHLSLLTRAGFSAADVLWKRFNFAVYVGLKEEKMPR